MLRNVIVRRPDNALQKLASVMELIYAAHEHGESGLFRHWLTTLPPNESGLLEQISWLLLQVSFPGGYCDAALFDARSTELARAHQQAENSQLQIEAYFKQRPECEQFRASFSRLKESWQERNALIRGVEINEHITQECWAKDLLLITHARGFKFYIDAKMPNSSLSLMAQALFNQIVEVHQLQAELNQMINADNKEAVFRKACLAWYVDGQVRWLKGFFEEDKVVEAQISSIAATLKPLRDKWLDCLHAQAQKDPAAEFLLKQHERWEGYLMQHPYYRDGVVKIKNPGLFSNTVSVSGEQLLRMAEVQLQLFHKNLTMLEQNSTNRYLTAACGLLQECYDTAPELREKIKTLCDECLKAGLDFHARIALLSVLEHCGYDLAPWSDAPVNRFTG